MDTALHCACDVLGGWLLSALWKHGTIAVALVTNMAAVVLVRYAIRVFLRLRSIRRDQ